MWESFFGFKKTPFSDSPDGKQLFASVAFQQVKTRLSEPADLADRLGDPFEQARMFAIRCRAPQLPPASSSAVNASTTSRSGLRPSRSRCRTTASTIASMSFMSTAPRPQTQPSAISPPNGSCASHRRSAGTTSRCPWMSSAGLRVLPSIRATRLVRFGCDSSTVGSSPTSARSPATCSAATRSPGPEWSPGFVVSILIRSRQMSTTSLLAAVTGFSVIALSSHAGFAPGALAPPPRWAILEIRWPVRFA